MSEAAAWLLAVARYLSDWELYRSGHPKVAATFEEVVEKLDELQSLESGPRFSFLEGKVILGDTPLEELEDWEWTPRFRDAGAGHLELSPEAGTEELRVFLDLLARAVHGETTLKEVADPEPSLPNIRYGRLKLRDQEEANEAEPEEAYRGTISLEEEAKTVEWLHESAVEEGKIPPLAALSTVESLSLALHGARELVIPFLKLREVDEYTAAHCINVSLVAMSLAERLEYDSGTVRELGLAGLLHDIGKVAVPPEVLNKPGELDEEEWRLVRKHPVEGARILFESGEAFELPAIVAYEHHRNVDGSGYPDVSDPRPPCRETRLVSVCDVYDAVRTKRAYKSPLTADEAREIIAEEAGESLDAEMAEAFLKFIREWDASEILLEEGAPETRPERAAEAPLT